MFPSASKAIDAANTLKEFGKYLNTLDTRDERIDELKNILYKFNANGFVNLCASLTEGFECPCPFGVYSLDELLKYKKKAIKAGNMRCAEMLDAKIKQMTG